MREDRGQVRVHPLVIRRSAQGRGPVWIRPWKTVDRDHGEGRTRASGKHASIIGILLPRSASSSAFIFLLIQQYELVRKVVITLFRFFGIVL